jgi:RNA polymerase sigma factor (sigma-70 family)
MSSNTLDALLRRVRDVSLRQAAAGVSDAELLGRFLRERDQAAFEVLVWRHGGMVLGVCRRMLRHTQDVEDAFQATFLVLVRKGNTISEWTSLHHWLHKVAYRIALRALKEAAKRRTNSNGIEEAAMATDDPSWREVRPVLDEEIARLPEKYRAVVLLCYLAGHSTTEAAGLLGIPRGTVLSRLSTARQLLRKWLLRRGFALSVAALTVGLAEAGLVSPAVEQIQHVLQAAVHEMAGTLATSGVVSLRTVSLTQGVVRSMGMSKIKLTAVLLVLAVLMGFGLSRWAWPPVAQAQEFRREVPPNPNGDGGTKVEVRTQTPASTVTRPLGMWERQIGPLKMQLHIESDRMVMIVEGQEKEMRFQTRLEAEYSVTKDGVLYGIVTSVDIDTTPAAVGSPRELANIMLTVNSFIDHPFSMRVRADENALTIKDINFGGLTKEGNVKDTNEVRAMLLGRYKKTNETPNPVRSPAK